MRRGIGRFFREEQIALHLLWWAISGSPWQMLPALIFPPLLKQDILPLRLLVCHIAYVLPMVLERNPLKEVLYSMEHFLVTAGLMFLVPYTTAL